MQGESHLFHSKMLADDGLILLQLIRHLLNRAWRAGIAATASGHRADVLARIEARRDRRENACRIRLAAGLVSEQTLVSIDHFAE
jgi:hypothetical protein